MNVFFAKFWIRVVRSMKNLPMSVREALAKVIARILWLAIPKRRHVIETNLRLCFPELSESERRSLAHRVYVRLARAAVDHGTLWESDKETIQKFVTFEGLENLLENKGEPIIVVAPHFAGLDAAGIALNTYVRGVSLYQKQSNPAWDEAVLAGRKRFSDPVLIAKSNESDLRPVLRAIRGASLLLPARHGPRNQELDFRAVLRRTGSHAADGLASCASDESKGPLVHCHDDRRGLPRHYLQAVGELPDGRLRSGYPKAQCRTRGMDSCISRPVPLGPPPLQDST